MSRKMIALVFVLVLAPSVTAQPQPSWNRRVTGLAITTAATGPGGTYDLTAEWRIDLVGSSTAPVEVGTAVDLSIAGGSPTTTTENECLIWDIDDAGLFDCTGQPDGTVCGTASISGKAVSLTCDADTETCSTPSITATFPGVPLIVKDFVEVILRPAPGALPDDPPNEDDDDGELTFGSWNRKLVAVSVTGTPGAPPGIYDVTAEVLIELTAGATVPLNLAIDTEPVSDPCCEEACCCPSCSTGCSGNGCGGTEILSMSLSSASICPGPSCNNTMCATGDSNGTGFTATCDPADCVCRSETVTLQWPGVSLTPGAEVYLNLRAAAGALPELQTDDDAIITIAPGAIPTVSSWGVGIMALLVVGAGGLVFRRRVA